MKQRELTIRSLILGVLLAAALTAANIYMGLRLAFIFDTPIPAAIISMLALRVLGSGSIRESNIVQTMATSAGALAMVIFVLPALLMTGVWKTIPLFSTFLLCALGGILGVLLSTPLRRNLAPTTIAPFPESIATAALLRAGATDRDGALDEIERKRGPLAVLWGAIASFVLQYIYSSGVSAQYMTRYFRVGAGASSFDMSISFGLFAVGHLVGISSGLALLVGILIAWAGLVPLLSQDYGSADIQTMVDTAWRQVRFAGLGAIGIVAVWTLVKFSWSLAGSLLKTRPGPSPKLSSRSDIPALAASGLAALCLLGLGWLIWPIASQSAFGSISPAAVVSAIAFVAAIGFLGVILGANMSALIGSTNSPVSSIAILTVLIASVLLAQFAGALSATDATVFTALVLFAAATVFTMAIAASANLQVLKTGDLVGATPWKQQLALIIGIIAASIAVPLVLNVLNHANGFADDPNRLAVGAEPLVAPQATLIAALVRGIFDHDLSWAWIGWGAAIGLCAILVDEMLGAFKLIRLPPLAVAMAIYLPMGATLPIVLGAFSGWVYNSIARRKQNGEMTIRLGVLMASGLIIGEVVAGFMNTLLYFVGNGTLPGGFSAGDTASPWPGIVAFSVFAFALYGWLLRQPNPLGGPTAETSPTLPPIAVEDAVANRTKVFVSYRRADTEAICGRLCDRLFKVFGRNRVFVDIDSIPYGDDFMDRVRRTISECHTILVLIGPNWRGPLPDGYRINDPHDFVRVEIEEAIRQGVKIIPVLVGHTQMLSPNDLPESLGDLPATNAAPLDQGRDFDVHINRLVRSIKTRN